MSDQKRKFKWIQGAELYQALSLVKGINSAILEGEYPKHFTKAEIAFIRGMAIRIGKFGCDTCISSDQQVLIQRLATKLYMYRIEQVYS